MRKSKKGQDLEIVVPLFLAIILCLIIWLFWAICVVEYNEYAYEKEFGQLKMDLKEPGITWVGFGKLNRLNNQVRSFNIKIDSASKDMQGINFDVNLNVKIKKEESYNFLKNYNQESIFVTYLQNKIQEKSKTIIFKYNAGEILANRLNISKEIYREINTIDELKYFEIKDLSLSNIEFSPEYDSILERKAQVDIEREIIIKQKQNLELQKNNIEVINVDTYFKYMLIEKWDGKAPLIISDALLINK